MKDKYDIFISYSRKDLDNVRKIKANIEHEMDTRCWMDLDGGIESGVPRFTKSIIEGINSCSVFLFMRSAASQDSEYALRELGYAKKKGKKVVIINIDNSSMNDEFEFLYGLTDTIEWQNTPQREKLLRDISRWIEDEEIEQEYLLIEALKWQMKGDEYYNEGNYKCAVEWWTKAAEAGEDSAQYNLGVSYECGYGVSQDFFQAVKWYNKAANQNNDAAQFALGQCYYHGNGVPEDEVKAIEWWTRAAEQGNENAKEALENL